MKGTYIHRSFNRVTNGSRVFVPGQPPWTLIMKLPLVLTFPLPFLCLQLLYLSSISLLRFPLHRFIFGSGLCFFCSLMSFALNLYLWFCLPRILVLFGDTFLLKSTVLYKILCMKPLALYFYTRYNFFIDWSVNLFFFTLILYFLFVCFYLYS